MAIFNVILNPIFTDPKYFMSSLRISLIIISFSTLIFTGCAGTEIVPPNKPVALKGTIQVQAEDMAPYNTQTGSGCIVDKKSSTPIQAHIVCRSKHSGEFAWNAVTATSKSLCKSQKWAMLFKRPPSLPKDNKGAFGAQMDIKCLE